MRMAEGRGAEGADPVVGWQIVSNNGISNEEAEGEVDGNNPACRHVVACRRVGVVHTRADARALFCRAPAFAYAYANKRVASYNLYDIEAQRTDTRPDAFTTAELASDSIYVLCSPILNEG